MMSEKLWVQNSNDETFAREWELRES
jgi:hypothetical protein